jgi:DNA-binding XRE family transcriptional regulator
VTPLVEELFIKAKRERLTQIKWAKLSNVNRKTLHYVKRDSKNAGLTTITKMGAGLGLKLTWVEE